MKQIKDLLNQFKAPEQIKKNPVHELVNFYLKSRGWDNMSKKFYIKNKISYPRLCKEAKELLLVFKGDLEESLRAIDDMSYRAKKQGFDWSLSTLTKTDLKVKL